MNTDKRIPESIYTPQILEFTALGVDFASTLERGGERRQYIERLVSILPRLYSSLVALPAYFYAPGEDLVEEYISEQSYERVRQKSAEILGEDDLYLTTVSADMQYSDTPIAQHISEHLADIYQHVGNLLGVIKEQNEIALPAAIGRCRLYWREYWGEALISVLNPLHTLYLAEDDIDGFDYDEGENYE